MSISYNLFIYDSERDDVSALEDLMTDIYEKEEYQLVSMKDSISPTGKYTVVVHYTITEPEEEKPDGILLTDGPDIGV